MVLKQQGQRGELVVEASIVLSMALILITAMFYLGMMLYQHTLMTAAANQAAVAAAQTYSNDQKDVFTGYIDPDSIYHSMELNGARDSAYLAVMQQKARLIALYRLGSLRILNSDRTQVTVSVVRKPGELLKSQVVVDIQEKYTLPFASFFGETGEVVFTTQGRADCYDLLEYLNGVDAISRGYEGGNAIPEVERCRVNFYTKRGDARPVKTVTVLRLYSISGSAAHTPCAMPQQPVREGFEFAGWVDESGNHFDNSTIVRGNLNVYGSWSCLITLDAQGGYVTPGNIRVNEGQILNLPVPVYEGHHFLGWYTEPGGAGSQWISGHAAASGGMTLYACWCQHRDPVTGASWMQMGTNEGDRMMVSCEEHAAGQRSRIRYICSVCGEEKWETNDEVVHYVKSSYEYYYDNVRIIRDNSRDSFNALCDTDHLERGGEYYWFSGYGSCYAMQRAMDAKSYEIFVQKKPFITYPAKRIQVRYHYLCEYCGMLQPKGLCPVYDENGNTRLMAKNIMHTGRDSYFNNAVHWTATHCTAGNDNPKPRWAHYTSGGNHYYGDSCMR